MATARPLDELERVVLAAWLASNAEGRLFFFQPVVDQRHAFRAASRMQHLVPDRLDLIRAALLHDVGKRHSGLGIIRRSLASASAKLRLPLGGRHATYFQHGPLGAEELQVLGCEPIVVDFARWHHDERPTSISAEDWRLLETADEPGKPPDTRSKAIR
ncbi:MAG: HDIG domain-containing protein [Acidimicrobiia bacterium]|nr:HDIG domain-containing protein [Acidimicrobiia bacterium]